MWGILGFQSELFAGFFRGGFSSWLFFGGSGGLRSWSGSRGGWLLVNDRGWNSVAFSSERWITLGKNNDTFDETPDGVASYSDPTDGSDTKEENAEDWKTDRNSGDGTEDCDDKEAA